MDKLEYLENQSRRNNIRNITIDEILEEANEAEFHFVHLMEKDS